MKRLESKDREDNRPLVIHVIYDFSLAGAQTVVMNYLRYMNQDSDFKVGVIVRDTMKGSALENEAKEKGYFIEYCNFKSYNGSKIIRPVVNWVRCQKSLKEKLNQYKPDVLHSHLSNIVPFIVFPSVLSKIKVRIHTLHSDPYAVEKRYSIWTYLAIHLFHFFPVCVTEGQAKKAVQKYKLKQYEVIHNGIDFKKYMVSDSKNDIRQELNIPMDKFVIGFVGTLCPIKNIPFLIQLFFKYSQLNANAVLLLVGDGVEYNQLKKLCEELNINEKVYFVGKRYDTERMYKAMDLFMLTSLFESSSIVTVEAQVSGLACIVSDAVPESVIISNKVKRLSLNDSELKWLTAIDGKAESCMMHCKQDSFSIDYTIKKTKNLYSELLKKSRW